jgi:hypothetical protein
MSMRSLVFPIVLSLGLGGPLMNAGLAPTGKSDQTIPEQQQPASTPSTEPGNPGSKANSPSETKLAYSKEAFVVEQLRERYRFENDGTGRKVATLRVHVLSEAGVQGFGQLRFGYNAANDRMEIGYVRVIKPDGSVVAAASDAIQDLMASCSRLLLCTATTGRNTSLFRVCDRGMSSNARSRPSFMPR